MCCTITPLDAFFLYISECVEFADGIVKYMRGKAGPSSKELKTAADFEKFTGSSEYVILGM